MDITALELWELWKFRYEQLAALMQLQQNLAAIEQEIKRRDAEKEKDGLHT